MTFRWDWQRARLARQRGQTGFALASYRRAVAELQSVRQDIPVEYRDGRSSYRTTFGPLYLEFTDMLLRRASHDAVEAPALNREARDTVEQLKETELQDYFREFLASIVNGPSKASTKDRLGSLPNCPCEAMCTMLYRPFFRSLSNCERVKAALPTIELLAPSGHTGLTATPTPNLYFFVSGPVIWPIRFTISAPLQPAPVIEVNIPPPSAAGVYGLHVADYPVRLEPDIIYTWSVSAILNSERPADDIVASASLLLVTPDPVLAIAPRAEPAARRAALFARAGFWYDAVAAAAEAAPIDHSAALDALMAEVGLVEPGYDRRAAGTATAR